MASRLRKAGRPCKSVLRLLPLIGLLFFAVAAVPACADTAQYYYDPDGRLVGVVDPAQGSAQYTYDATGNILAVANNALSSVSVVGFNPPTGAAGTVVTIGGTGFDTAADTTVNFNGTAATPSAVTANSITVTVPVAATTGPVTVTAPAGSVTSSANFLVVTAVAPQITGFSPTTVAQGDTVTISGSGFDPVNGKVEINGRAASIVSATATSIVVNVPMVSSGRVTVETPVGSATSPADLIVAPAGFAAAAVTSAQRVTFPAVGASQTATVTIGSAGGVALVLFDTTAGQVASAVETATSLTSGQFVLYGPDGNIVSTSDYGLNGPAVGSSPASVSNGANAFMRAELVSPAGTYVLAVSSGGAGSATIALYDVPPFTSPQLTAGGPPVTFALTTPGELPTFKFSGTAGELVRLVTLLDPAFGNASFSNNLAVTAPDGVTRIYFGNTVSATSNLTGVMTLPTSGTYTAQYVPAGPTTGNVTMQLDVPVTGTLTVGGPAVMETITQPGAPVVMTFAGTAGQSVRLVMQIDQAIADGFSNQLTITAPDGTTQLFFAGTVPSTTFLTSVLALPTTGTYSIRFVPAGAAAGNVTMQLDVPLAGTLTVGGPTVTETITQPGDAVVMTFAGTAGQTVQLVTQIPQAIADGFFNQLTITEPDGATQLFSAAIVPQTTFFSSVLTLPTTGIYSIRFVPASNATGNVSMTLYDAGVTTGNATDFTATIATAGATAQMLFSGSAGSRVSLLTVADTNLRQGCFTISMTASGASTPLYSSTQSGFSDFSHALTLPASGLYTMLLTPCGSATGTAALTLYTVPADATGSMTIGGSAVSLTTTAPGQNAVVTFPSSVASQAVNITVTADASFSSACYTVTVLALSPDGTTLSVGGSGSLIGLDGIWSFGTQTAPGGNAILLNGTQVANGWGLELATAQGGHGFTRNDQGNWYEWIGAWSGTADPLGGGSGTPAGPPTSGQGCGTSYSTGALTLGPAGTNTVKISSVGAAFGNVTVGVTQQ